MRIIAGQRRGHKIDGPRPKADMRPTSDLVRESIFNIVGGLMPGRVAVDLFAGTGAVGLEALSRGAERAIFIEKNRENVGLIHRNIAILRYRGSRHGPAGRCLSLGQELPAGRPGSHGRFPRSAVPRVRDSPSPDWPVARVARRQSCLRTR